MLVEEGLFQTAALGLKAAASAMDDSGAEGDVVDCEFDFAGLEEVKPCSSKPRGFTSFFPFFSC